MNSNKNITISKDVLFVNTILFFSTIRRKIRFTTIECISNRTLNQLVSSMVTAKLIYSNMVFYINNSLMEGEFEPMQSKFRNMKIDMNTSSPNEHIPDIEWQINFIK